MCSFGLGGGLVGVFQGIIDAGDDGGFMGFGDFKITEGFFSGSGAHMIFDQIHIDLGQLFQTKQLGIDLVGYDESSKIAQVGIIPVQVVFPLHIRLRHAVGLAGILDRSAAVEHEIKVRATSMR